MEKYVGLELHEIKIIGQIFDDNSKKQHLLLGQTMIYKVTFCIGQKSATYEAFVAHMA